MIKYFTVLSVLLSVSAPVFAAEIYPYRHAHRDVQGAYGFNNAMPQDLVDADIIRGIRDGKGKKGDVVVTGTQFLNLAHGEQQSAMRSFVGNRIMIIKDGTTNKTLGVFSPAGGVQFY